MQSNPPVVFTMPGPLDDIVQRLELMAAWSERHGRAYHLHIAAAKEIRRLRADLAAAEAEISNLTRRIERGHELVATLMGRIAKLEGRNVAHLPSHQSECGTCSTLQDRIPEQFCMEHRHEPRETDPCNQ